MVFGIGLIFLLQWVFLGNLRSAVIVGMTIPFALFFAVGILVMRGESANLLSVGAIDFGLIVDATVIMVESIFRWLSGHGNRRRPRRRSGRCRRPGCTASVLAIFHAAADVNRSIFFAAGIIIAGFIPLFTLSGVEGHIFGPMAQTYAYALAGGLIATFTVTPALSALILPEHVQETETLVVRVLHRIYTPVLRFAIRHKAIIVGGAVALLVVAGLAVRVAGPRIPAQARRGQSLDPRHLALDDLARGRQHLRQPDAPAHRQFPGGGIRRIAAGPAGRRHRRRRLLQRRVLRAAQARRANGGPRSDKDDLTERGPDASCRLNFPGVEFNFSQYLQDNVAEAVSGVKGENSIKLFGNDLQVISDTAAKIKSVLATVHGITDLAVFTSLGQPTVQIDIDRKRAARYGLTPRRHQRDDQGGDRRRLRPATCTSRAATGIFRSSCGSRRSSGRAWRISGTSRSRSRVRRVGAECQRSTQVRQFRRCGAAAGGLMQIPLTEVATVKLVSGASYIYREQQQRYLPIKFSVRDRDLGSAIQEAQAKIAEQVPLPPGSRMEWVGEFGNLQDAIARLKLVVPLSLVHDRACCCGSISARSRTRLLAMSVIPMAVIGGVLGAVRDRHSVQRLGGDRLHRAVRHCRDGRHHHPVAVQQADRYRARTDRRGAAHRRSCRCGRC